MASLVERSRVWTKMSCSIAHRGKSSESVEKAEVADYLKFIKKLAAKTGGKVNSHVKAVTGKPL